MKIGDKINFRTCKETTRHWQFSQKSRENGPYRKKKKKVSFLVICKRNIGSHLLMSDTRTFETFGPQATLCMVWYANTYCCSFSIINNISTYQSSTCYLSCDGNEIEQCFLFQLFQTNLPTCSLETLRLLLTLRFPTCRIAREGSSWYVQFEIFDYLSTLEPHKESLKRSMLFQEQNNSFTIKFYPARI